MDDSKSYYLMAGVFLGLAIAAVTIPNAIKWIPLFMILGALDYGIAEVNNKTNKEQGE